jgi:hypothetical protein
MYRAVKLRFTDDEDAKPSKLPNILQKMAAAGAVFGTLSAPQPPVSP